MKGGENISSKNRIEGKLMYHSFSLDKYGTFISFKWILGLLEYQSNSKHFAKSGQLIEARVLVFFFGRFLFFQAPASYHLRLFSWMMNSFWGKSGQPLMRDLFFLFRAPLFALLLLCFLLRPLRHCYYTLVEEERQKEFLWKGGGGAEEEFFCSAKSCFCLSFSVFVSEKDPGERSCLESFPETLPLLLLLLNTLCNLAMWITTSNETKS